jgi:hypothetical protein
MAFTQPIRDLGLLLWAKREAPCEGWAWWVGNIAHSRTRFPLLSAPSLLFVQHHLKLTIVVGDSESSSLCTAILVCPFSRPHHHDASLQLPLSTILGGCCSRCFCRLCHRPSDLYLTGMMPSVVDPSCLDQTLIDNLFIQAPCAASAVSYNIQSQTYSNCPEAVGPLQSCVCTKDRNLASISSAISSSVSYSCGSTASEDQASAATVS